MCCAQNMQMLQVNCGPGYLAVSSVQQPDQPVLFSCFLINHVLQCCSVAVRLASSRCSVAGGEADVDVRVGGEEHVALHHVQPEQDQAHIQ